MHLATSKYGLGGVGEYKNVDAIEYILSFFLFSTEKNIDLHVYLFLLLTNCVHECDYRIILYRGKKW